MKVTYSVELLEATINKQVERIAALETALRASQMALNAVRILMKNQDRREHEEKIYDGVRITLDMVEAALAPETEK